MPCVVVSNWIGKLQGGAPESRAAIARLAKEKSEFLEMGTKGVAACHCCGSCSTKFFYPRGVGRRVLDVSD